MERVAVRVLENGKTIKTVTLSRNVAEQWVARQPKNYEIVAPPKIEVTKLQPISIEPVQKKSAEDAPKIEESKPKKKGGRPKKSV